ncbi:hypothetical protein [Oceanobacillus jeddahense]|uniref:hypothetical protein n=1 Tax=Oceanobacillus jeddahense TaxID=1462527 RepID=UPI000ABF71D2|nr:hypothetical protein [Oceanobacillus jeddahense]
MNNGKHVEVNEFYYALIEGEDENGNVIHGEPIKFDEVKTLTFDTRPKQTLKY